MFFKDFFAKRPPRRFAYVPYYYKEEQAPEENGHRIKFRRIRQGSHVTKRSVRSMILLVLFILVCMIYFWEMLQREVRTFDIESIKIEEIPVIE